MGWLSQRLNPSCALLRPQRGRACSGFLSPPAVLGLDHLLEPLREAAVVFDEVIEQIAGWAKAGKRRATTFGSPARA
jgi:hypothetical protein